MNAGAAGRPLLIIVLLIAAGPASGEEGVAFDFDEPPETDHPITDSLTFGAEIELDGVHLCTPALDRDGTDALSTLEPTLQVALTWEPEPRLRAFLDLELARLIVGDSPPDGETDRTSLAIKEAYLTFRELLPGFTAQVGRLSFQDPREWFYDQELDGVRGTWRQGVAAVEASLSRQGLVDEDFLQTEDSDGTRNAFLVGHYAMGEEASAAAYLLGRDGRGEESEDLTFFGLQALGQPLDGTTAWLNAAVVSGEVAEEDGARDVLGFGVDLALTRVFATRFEPSLTLGFAYGTGDPDPDDRTDHGFRQTGLQENEAAFNGITRFKTYGEVLDPELSNLLIVTLGTGIRPTGESSIDLVYHAYLQDEPANELRDSNLLAEPLGRHRMLGHGLDLILGHAGIEDLEAELVLGAFFPGRAFADDAEPAGLVTFEVVYAF